MKGPARDGPQRNNSLKSSNRLAISKIIRQVSSKKPSEPKSKQNLAKSLSMRGLDYMSSLSSALPNQLDDGVKLVFSRQVTPSMFPQTKLQTTSKTFQKYKFLEFKVNYKPSIPDSINGVYIAYFDTDALDKPIIANKENLLRLAQSHQNAVQRSANASWSVSLPISNTDDLYFTGTTGDDRLTKQGTLYIYQIGAITNFSGESISKQLDMGLLNISWNIVFSAPQMSAELSVYDGVSQKDVLRTFKNLTTYTEFTVSGISNGFVLIGTRFRWASIPILPSWLNKGGIGSYMIVRLPQATTLSNSVKAVHSMAEPYGYDKYKTDLGTKLTSGLFNTVTLNNYIEQAFQLTKEGIKVAKLVYDVTTVIASLFVKDSTIGTLTSINYAAGDIDTNTAYVPIGANVVYWDGVHVPVVQDMIEFQDNAHALDAAVTVSYPVTLLLYKLEKPLLADTVVDSTVPKLPT